MTQANKLKRAARARAEKTGESYAAARRHVVRQLDKQRDKSTKRAAETARAATAKGVVTEARCIEKTGHGFDHWFRLLDRFGAKKKGHTASAKHLREEHGVSAWYCQAITVSYERARGIREVNQACTGSYQVSVSRVLSADLQTATRALARKGERARWIEDAGALGHAVHRLLDGRRFTRKDDASHVRIQIDGAAIELRVTLKDDNRSTVLATLSKLRDQDAVKRARDEWRALLDALRGYLNG